MNGAKGFVLTWCYLNSSLSHSMHIVLVALSFIEAFW